MSQAGNLEVEKFNYDNKIVRNFAFASILWGAVGMLAGLYVALQLVFPSLNITQFGSFGRLRPLHTNAVISVSYTHLRAHETG
jgi:cytochrome c oxidase cbb3-type subunit I/II